MGTTYGELFAANVRGARARADLRVKDVAERMNALGYTNWNDSKVSKVERVITPVQVAELFALAVALETTISDLIGAHTVPTATVAFPAGQEVTGVYVSNLAYGWPDQGVMWNDNEPVIIRSVRPEQVGPVPNRDEIRNIRIRNAAGAA